MIKFNLILKYPRIPENPRETFANFAPKFKNINVGRDDIDPFMKDYAEKEEFWTQPWRILMSRYFLENGAIVTPVLLFYLTFRLVCKEIYAFVQYTPIKCFNNFIQSAVNTGREGDENPNSGVVAETMKFLANSCYGYQILDGCRHIVTKGLSDEKTHGAINNKMFKCLG